jgi:regulator of replication initiation timing
MAAEQEQTAQAQSKLLEITGQATKEAETLRIENERLKEQLRAAEAKSR